MAKKQMSWKTKGMNRDLSVSAFNPEFAFENRNLRLSTNDSNTLMSWVNEKGTEKIRIDIEWYTGTKLNPSGNWLISEDTHINGIVIGTAIISNYLILFSHDIDNDYIYRLQISGPNYMTGMVLYRGNLNFDTAYPIETLVSYESEKILKVYWTDNRNQPRVINITADKDTIVKWTCKKEDCFDFVRPLNLNENVSVKKLLGASGTFPAGVIQYAFTYYDKYGLESNIFYTTPLLYISHRDRGGSPEDKIDNAFLITIHNVDENFDYLRIYSIIRTSINSTPLCKRVLDLSISNMNKNGSDIHTTFVDNGNIGDSVDPTELLYLGGESIICNTIELKDNTLFLGNLKLMRSPINNLVRTDIYNALKGSQSVSCRYTRSFMPMAVDTGDLAYSNQLTSEEVDTQNNVTGRNVPCGGFKWGDKYRLGVLFLFKTGKWSDPIWIGDHTMEDTQITNTTQERLLSNGKTIIDVPVFRGRIPAKCARTLINDGYRKARAVCVYPGIQDRNILCQGIINPVVYTKNHRKRLSDISLTENQSEEAKDYIGDLYALASWFFRGSHSNISFSVLDAAVGDMDIFLIHKNKSVRPWGRVGELPYYLHDLGANISSANADWYTELMPCVEILGIYKDGNRYQIDNKMVTFNSPDVEFDPLIINTDFSNTKYKQIGAAIFHRTLSDIDILTSTPTISGAGAGFVHKTFNEKGAYGIISGLFYDDYIIDDSSGDLKLYDRETNSVKWMVYLWNKSGSLNNDITREAGKGIQSAVLKEKRISNLRYTKPSYGVEVKGSVTFPKNPPKLFNSEEDTIIKIGDAIYKGNVDELLIPDYEEGKYFSSPFEHTTETTMAAGTAITVTDFNNLGPADFTDSVNAKLWAILDSGLHIINHGFYTQFNKYLDTSSLPIDELYGINKDRRWYPTPLWGNYKKYSQDESSPEGSEGQDSLDHIGNDYLDLTFSKTGVRMKYKSTPHLVFRLLDTSNIIWGDLNTNISWDNANSIYKEGFLPIVEIILDPVLPFGGENKDVLQSNIWIPCGEPVNLTNSGCLVEWSYGDTYYQRWDCLKTYAFTHEDENLVIEIGSFMLETRLNIDGRYDKNRCQVSNLYMTPLNFNLINPVYSQVNNFFTYRILDSSFYEDNIYPTKVTWTKTKIGGADIDLWTNITLASILDLDGDKGKLNKIIRFNGQLIAFLDMGISLILFNENTAITTTEGAPIELMNSGKVLGTRYLNNAIGCSNKWSIVSSPSNIYFMDNYDKSIYVFNGLFNNLSITGGFNVWSKLYIGSELPWDPKTFVNFVGHYDKQNLDVLFINSGTALAWSEKLGAFTSFYDYGGASYLCNLEDVGIWIKNTVDKQNNYSELWKHLAGEYCNFFGEQKDYGTILIGNPEPITDKTFTNLEFRACLDNDSGNVTKTVNGIEKQVFEFLLPFDYLETWNEYQHGIANLQWKDGHGPMRHHLNDEKSTAHLARKFRIWRCDIPRDNLRRVDVFDYTFDKTFHLPKDNHKRDRMRNPWLYIKLKKNAYNIEDTLHENPLTNNRAEIHDFVMTYYN